MEQWWLIKLLEPLLLAIYAGDWLSRTEILTPRDQVQLLSSLSSHNWVSIHWHSHICIQNISVKLFQLFQLLWLCQDIHGVSINLYIKTQSITIVLNFFLTLFTVKTGLTTLMIGHEQVDEDYIMNRLVDPIKNMSARWENGKSGKLKETRFNPASII